MTCPHWDCPNRTEYGYCRFTACCNPEYTSFTATANTGTNYMVSTDYVTNTIQRTQRVGSVEKEDNT